MRRTLHLSRNEGCKEGRQMGANVTWEQRKPLKINPPGIKYSDNLYLRTMYHQIYTTPLQTGIIATKR